MSGIDLAIYTSIKSFFAPAVTLFGTPVVLLIVLSIFSIMISSILDSKIKKRNKR